MLSSGSGSGWSSTKRLYDTFSTWNRSSLRNAFVKIWRTYRFLSSSARWASSSNRRLSASKL